ncbi:MAG: dependent oxidoreductase [Actinomycetia bacterium]|nr:dependent oxidoreductase [Actinomycetes bacterium]
MTTGENHATVVGSGPNGLLAAITLARAGLDVTVFEAAPQLGGGLRTEPLTLDGFVHDVCSAVHPLALASPAFADLDLEGRGVHWCSPEVALAHPLDGGIAAYVVRSVDRTAENLGADASAYRKLMTPLVEHGDAVVDGMLSALQIPRAPVTLARFGLSAIRSARGLARSRFVTPAARAMFGGIAAHAMLPLTDVGTAGYGLFLGLLAHHVGWPVVEGGSQVLADSLVAVLEEHGGKVVTDHEVTSLAELPPSRAVVLDLTPRQILRVADGELPHRYARSLRRFRYGPGVFKIDWALDGPVPWSAPEACRTATVHLGGTLEEMVLSESESNAGRLAERPYVLFVQPTVVDPTRAPTGKHVAWAYCHVPNGSTADRTDAIEAQVERFAPGFRDLVLARSVMNSADVERHNANYVGGDINGGAGDIRQLFTRPVVSPHPWVTPRPGLYICSSSTPPGGGVHGMCGLHAARAVLARPGARFTR